MSLHVLLVEDDRALRQTLASALEAAGYAVTGSGSCADAVALLTHHPQPIDLMVLDLRMPVMSGLQLQERLLAGGCDWPFILLTGHGGLEACRRAFKAGAVDFLTKPVDEEALIEAVQAGFARLDGARSRDAERVEARALLARLTAREREVLAMVGNGHATKEIARALDLSPRTVETHRANIAAKLGTASVAEMARVVLLAGP